MPSRIAELDPIREELEEYIEGTAKRMGESTICMSLFTDNYKKGIDAMIQFSLALMMEKPLYLLVPRGVRIPPKVEAVADGIEFYDGGVDSMKAASTRLIHRAMQREREKEATREQK